MAKSKITGKTFEEMLSESTELDLSAKFKDIIYEFSNDVHAMGIVVYTYEEENAKFLFKDPAFTQPVTDYELLAMYLDEVVATRLVDSDMSLERCGYFETEKVNFLEYKEDNFLKKFYKIGNYFSGETYFDLNGFAPGDSELALVDSAIVDTSVVGEEEAPAMQTIWEDTFTPTEEEETPFGKVYSYTTEDVQNAELLKNVSEVNVTFDGTLYTLPVVFGGDRYTIGELSGENATPFMFAYDAVSEPNYAGVGTLTDGPHTIKIEGNPVEPSSEVLYENTFSGISFTTSNVQNLGKITEMQAVKATFDGTSYILNADRDEEHDMWSLGSSAFADCPFFLIISEITDTDTETSETSYEMTIETETGGEHTIKIETTDEPAENPGGGAVVPGGGAVVINPQG